MFCNHLFISVHSGLCVKRKRRTFLREPRVWKPKHSSLSANCILIHLQGHKLSRKIEPKPWQTRNLQTQQKYYEINIRDRYQIRLLENIGEGKIDGEGELKLRNIGCLLNILLLTTGFFPGFLSFFLCQDCSTSGITIRNWKVIFNS